MATVNRQNSTPPPDSIIRDIDDHIQKENYSEVLPELRDLLAPKTFTPAPSDTTLHQIYSCVARSLPNIGFSNVRNFVQTTKQWQHLLDAKLLGQNQSGIVTGQVSLACAISQAFFEEAKQDKEQVVEGMRYAAIANNMQRQHPVSKSITPKEKIAQVFHLFIDTEEHKKRIENRFTAIKHHDKAVVDKELQRLHRLAQFCATKRQLDVIKGYFKIARDKLCIPDQRDQISYELLDRGLQLKDPKPSFIVDEYQERIRKYRRSLHKQADTQDQSSFRTFQSVKSEEFKQILRDFLNDAFLVLGDPPCQYSFYLTGSLAREAIYSRRTVRYGILIEDEKHHTYFDTLAKFFEMQIYSLGEFEIVNGVNFTMSEKNKGIDVSSLSPKVATPHQLIESHLHNPVDIPPKSEAALTDLVSIHSNDEGALLRLLQEAQSSLLTEDFRIQRGLFLLKDQLDRPLDLPTQLTKDDVKKHFIKPLFHMIYDFGFILGIPDTNPIDILDQLKEKKVFDKESTAFLKQSIIFLAKLHIRLTPEERKPGERRTSQVSQENATSNEKAFLESIEAFALKSLHQYIEEICDSEQEFRNHVLVETREPIDLFGRRMQMLHDSWGQIPETNRPDLMKTLVRDIDQLSDPEAIHQKCYTLLSDRFLEGDPLRHAYIKALQDEQSDAVVQLLAPIHDRSGFRQSTRLGEEKLYADIQSLASSLPLDTMLPPGEIRVKVQGGPFPEGIFLKPEAVEKIINPQTGEICRWHEYEDSAHNVCRYEEGQTKLHFKEHPNQPMMEYAMHTLTSRLVGDITASTCLLKFEVSIPKRKPLIYPVLVSQTLAPTTLKKKLGSDPKFKPDSRSLTKHVLASIITRPGDASSKNQVVAEDTDQLFSIDNDIVLVKDDPKKSASKVPDVMLRSPFMEPIINKFGSRIIQFSSILFLLEKQPLSKEEIEAFLEIHPGYVFSSWIKELIQREQAYLKLFHEQELKDLYDMDGAKKTVIPLAFPKGALLTLLAQCFRLQAFLRANRQSILDGTLAPLHLLTTVMTLDEGKECQLGTKLHDKYNTAYKKGKTPQERLEFVCGVAVGASMSTSQSMEASHGRTPKYKEIRTGELSLAQAKKDLEYFYITSSEEVECHLSSDRLAINFIPQDSSLTRQTERLVLNAAKELMSSQQLAPQTVIINQCRVLTSEMLLPFLHDKVTHLELRGTSIKGLPKDLAASCPNLEVLYLSGSQRLKSFPTGTFEHLKILHIANCPKLHKVHLTAPKLEEAKLCETLDDFDVRGLVDVEKVKVSGNGRVETEFNYAFGRYDWRKYFGEVGSVPLLPKNIKNILDSQFPYGEWKGKKFKDLFILTLIPSTIDGNDLTLNTFQQLVGHPKAGEKVTDYKYYETDVKTERGCKPNLSSQWVLLTKEPIPKLSRMNRDRSALALDSRWQLPKLLDATVSILAHYLKTGTKLYPSILIKCDDIILGNIIGYFLTLAPSIDTDPPEFEKYENLSSFVGKFSAQGLSIEHDRIKRGTNEYGRAKVIKL